MTSGDMLLDASSSTVLRQFWLKGCVGPQQTLGASQVYGIAPCSAGNSQGTASLSKAHLLYQGKQLAEVVGLLLIQSTDLLDESILRLIPLHLPSRQAFPAPHWNVWNRTAAGMPQMCSGRYASKVRLQWPWWQRLIQSE